MKVELHGLAVYGMLFIYYSATFVDFNQGQGHVLHLRRGAEKWTFNFARVDNAFNIIYRLHEQPKV